MTDLDRHERMSAWTHNPIIGLGADNLGARLEKTLSRKPVWGGTCVCTAPLLLICYSSQLIQKQFYGPTTWISLLTDQPAEAATAMNEKQETLRWLYAIRVNRAIVDRSGEPNPAMGSWAPDAVVELDRILTVVFKRTIPRAFVHRESVPWIVSQ